LQEGGGKMSYYNPDLAAIALEVQGKLKKIVNSL
jgi:hypothetical protein